MSPRAVEREPVLLPAKRDNHARGRDYEKKYEEGVRAARVAIEEAARAKELAGEGADSKALTRLYSRNMRKTDPWSAGFAATLAAVLEG